MNNEVKYTVVNSESITICPHGKIDNKNKPIIVGSAMCARCERYHGSGGYLENARMKTILSVSCF